MSPFLLVVAVCIFFLISGILVLSLRDIYGMEARIGLFVRAMLSGQGFFCPLLYNKPYPDYPPLYFLISWLFCNPIGHVCPVCISAPSLFSGTLLLIVLFMVSKSYIGQRAALMSSVILVASPKFWPMAQSASIDMLLALFCLLANVSFFHGYCLEDGEGSRNARMLGFVFMSISYLVKGPIGLVISSLPTAVFLIIKRRTRLLACFFSFALLSSAIVIGFYMAGIYSQGGLALVEQVLSAQLLSRISGQANKPFYYYPVFLLLAFLPVFILLGFIYQDRFARAGRTFKQCLATEFSLFMAIFTISALLPFFFASSRHGRYLLPAFCPIALLLSCFIAKSLENEEKEIFPLLKWLSLGLVATVYLIVPILYFWDPFHSSLPWWSIAGFFFIGTAVLGIFFLPKDDSLIMSSRFFLSVFFIILGISLGVQPGLSKRESGRQFVLMTESMVKARMIFLAGFRPDGDGLKYSLYSRYYPNDIRFLPSLKNISLMPKASLLILYAKEFDGHKGKEINLDKFSIISEGYIHSKKTIALYKAL